MKNKTKLSLPFFIARRYLFSKKSHNAINIVSAISAGGVLVGTMALVCVLSVFNGFGTLIEGSFTAFDPDLKITLAEGKTFSADEMHELRTIPEVAVFAEVLQENVMLRYRDKPFSGIIKGVNDGYQNLTNIENIMYDGDYLLKDRAFNYGVGGIGLAVSLGFQPSFSEPLYIIAPQRTEKIVMSQPENSFVTDHVFVSGVFEARQAEYDNRLLIIPISLARELYQYDSLTVTSIELKFAAGSNAANVQKKIQKLLGERFKVQNRYEQQEDFFRLMRVEKWFTYLILSFILMIAVFNIIGSLSMLIIDKTADIKILRNMGASGQLVRRIFLFEGWLISIVGMIAGIAMGGLICLLQQHFGWLTVPNGSQPFPVDLQMLDLLLVFVTVGLMGFLAAYYPVRGIKVE